MKKSVIILSLILSTSASAGGKGNDGGKTGMVESAPVVSTRMIEVGFGAESQIFQYSALCRGACEPTCGGCEEKKLKKGADHSRSGTTLELAFKGVRLTQGNAEFDPARTSFTVLPIGVGIDLMHAAQSQSFGRVKGLNAQKIENEKATRVRRFYAVLIEGQTHLGGDWIGLRGKLVRGEFNRDKGFWDWRALEAYVGIDKTVHYSSSIETHWNFKLMVGGGIGGVYLNQLSDLERELSMQSPNTGAYTLNPGALVSAAWLGKTVKAEAAAHYEKRIGLENQPSFEGKKLSVDSEVLKASVEMEYTFNEKGLDVQGQRISVFARGSVDLDTLTLGRMFFGSDDSFQSYQIKGGIRAQF